MTIPIILPERRGRERGAEAKSAPAKTPKLAKETMACMAMPRLRLRLFALDGGDLDVVQR